VSLLVRARRKLRRNQAPVWVPYNNGETECKETRLRSKPLHPVAQSNGTQLRSDRVETGAMSFVVKPLAVGVRVRIKQPSIQIADEYGIVTRLDARGACVKLDSGREFLVEPAMLERACKVQSALAIPFGGLCFLRGVHGSTEAA